MHFFLQLEKQYEKKKVELFMAVEIVLIMGFYKVP